MFEKGKAKTCSSFNMLVTKRGTTIAASFLMLEQAPYLNHLSVHFLIVFAVLLLKLRFISPSHTPVK
ncbi:hypothetical protein [Bacillus sp. mrc49]|uniref:hypothetical protein n=1 Tax=Bacillus sp. mrc49 TaxID=2054913 RepID=UPI0012FD3471|nr:hypothetical protein [Bacillus sp. mrc49]